MKYGHNFVTNIYVVRHAQSDKNCQRSRRLITKGGKSWQEKMSFIGAGCTLYLE